MRMFGVVAVMSAMVVAVTPAAQNKPAAAQKPTALFDGKTLNGWEGDLKVFRVADGAIVAGTLEDKIPRNEFLCTTATYGDFELRLKFKLLGGDNANAGVQFRRNVYPTTTRSAATRRTWASAGGARSTTSRAATRCSSDPTRRR